MTRAQRADAARNRDRLLEVASEAFARDGVDASLEGIAKAAGVGVGTLYRHFPNRDALMEAVYRRNVDVLVGEADDLLANKPPAEALAEWMQRFVAYVATKRGLAVHLKTVMAADSELFTYSQERLNGTVRRLVAAAVESGEIRADVDPGDVLRALSGVCLISDLPGWQDQARRISGLLMDGLRYGAGAG
ncbi:MAG TPA: TetR/AcrR family transcriptional regulator [Acidimicrobiales bacterium]|nr:TetR/AcrR family transcriptional regulator [Acidimicrobiales bacterium]